MWLLFLAGPIIVVMVVGGLIAGGVYGIVLVPIAVIIAILAAGYSLWMQAAKRSDVEAAKEGVDPLPHAGHSNTAAAPTSPEQLVDAQRQAQ